MYVEEIVDVNILNCGYSNELRTIMSIGDVHLNICICNVHSSWKITLKLIYDMGRHAHYNISYNNTTLKLVLSRISTQYSWHIMMWYCINIFFMNDGSCSIVLGFNPHENLRWKIIRTWYLLEIKSIPRNNVRYKNRKETHKRINYTT